VKLYFPAAGAEAMVNTQYDAAPPTVPIAAVIPVGKLPVKAHAVTESVAALEVVAI